jgi:MFS family permease
MQTTSSAAKHLSGIGRKTIVVIFASQGLMSAGFIATAALLPIIGDELSSNHVWAGVPFATMQIAAAVFAYIWGILWDRVGRRRGFSLGLLLGGLGMLTGAAAIQTGSMGLFLVGLIGYGAARAASQLARFIAAEVNPPSLRGRAISLVLLGCSLGIFGAPLLTGLSNRWAQGTGMTEMAGTFTLSAMLLGLSFLIAWVGLHPEPLEVSREMTALLPETEFSIGPSRSLLELGRQPGIFLATMTMVLAQMVRVMVLAITALYMAGSNHTIESISIVFSAHTLGMFAFSVFSGKLADRWGRLPVIFVGGGLMIGSLAVAPLTTSVPVLATALFLLALGWNLCFVAGSALLADHLRPAERSRTQGSNDLLVGLVSALGILSSGVIFAWMGFWIVSLMGGLFILAVLALSGWLFVGERKKAYALRV